MVEFEIETIDIGLFVRMSSGYVIPIFSDYVIPIFRRQEVTYLQTRYIVKVVPDAASLRHEFRVSTGRKAILWRKMHAKWRNGGFLIDFLGFLPVETRNSCLSEASSVTTLTLRYIGNICNRFNADEKMTSFYA